jgi:outer membrane protein assembly factor BamB
MQPIGWSGVVINNGTAFTGSKEGRLVSVNLSNSSKLLADTLKLPASGSSCSSSSGGSACGGTATAIAIYGSPAFANVPVFGDLVYVAGYNGKVFAYDAANLQQRWVYPVDGNLNPIVGGVTISGSTLFFGGTDGYVYALDTSTGALKWKHATNGEIWASPTVDNDTVFISSFDRKVYALSAATGDEKWTFTTGANNVATALVSGGIVYVGSLDRNLYALNETDGKEIWRYTGGNWFWAKPVLANGLIFAPNLDNNVYALDAKLGAQGKLQTFDMQGQVAAWPVVVNNQVVVATQNAKLWTIDATNLTVSPVLVATIPENATAPLAADGDKVYVNAPDNKIYGYNITTKAVLQSISLASQ